MKNIEKLKCLRDTFNVKDFEKYEELKMCLLKSFDVIDDDEISFNLDIRDNAPSLELAKKLINEGRANEIGGNLTWVTERKLRIVIEFKLKCYNYVDDIDLIIEYEDKKTYEKFIDEKLRNKINKAERNNQLSKIGVLRFNLDDKNLNYKDLECYISNIGAGMDYAKRANKLVKNWLNEKCFTKNFNLFDYCQRAV